MLIVGMAITPLHPGAGRAPGVVDLPVARDSMGYPIIFASALKGALKALCGRELCKKSDGSLCVDSDKGRLKCDECDDKCRLCCCLFGSEPEESESHPGVLSVLDFVPFAFPVPSADLGYVYVTSRLLLNRVHLVLDALDYANVDKARELKQAISELVEKSSDDESLALVEVSRDNVDIAGMREKVRRGEISNLSKLAEVLSKLGGLASTLTKRLIVVPDSKAVSVIEKALIRITRVRLRRDRKTVVEGALWTEEYIPPGTVFIGGVIALPLENKYCRKYYEGKVTSKSMDLLLEQILDDFKREVLEAKENTVYFVVGGKETIGRGLIKAVVY